MTASTPRTPPRRARFGLVWVLVCALLPIGPELVGEALTSIMDARAINDPGCPPDCPDGPCNDCTGVPHQCSCCQLSSVVVVGLGTEISSPTFVELSPRHVDLTGTSLDAHVATPFQPPRAA